MANKYTITFLWQGDVQPSETGVWVWPERTRAFPVGDAINCGQSGPLAYRDADFLLRVFVVRGSLAIVLESLADGRRVSAAAVCSADWSVKAREVEMLVIGCGPIVESLATDTAAQSAVPQPSPEVIAKRRELVVKRMAMSIQEIANLDPEQFAPRLKMCEACKDLRLDGCGRCVQCGQRWPEWRLKIIDGTCDRFS